MKSHAKLILGLVLIFCLATSGLAQGVADCDELKGKIAQLEQMDMNMSAPLRQLHKETLLELYTQLRSCIERDISAASQMQQVVKGTSAARAIDEKLQALNKEKTDTDNKILLLGEALRLGVASRPSAESLPQPTPATEPAVGNGSAHGNGATPPSDPARPVAAQQEFPCVATGTYADAPALLTDIVSKSVDDAINEGDADEIASGLQKMILYTIVDAASETSSKQFRTLEAYQYLGETARTDKQLAGSANSDGAVSGIEKPGFAQLLGFAIEHGGITKKNDGTNLTLSTSLYSLYAMKNGDTAENYDRAGFLNRIGVSSTFAIDNNTNELANARRNNLSEWSVKARLFGDRSTRSRSYQDAWNRDIRPVIRARLIAIGGAIEGLRQGIPQFSQFTREYDACLRTAVAARMGQDDYKAATLEEKKRMLNSLVLGSLQSGVFQRVKGGQLKVGQELVSQIEGQHLPNLKTALDNLVKADVRLQEMIDNLNKGPLATLAYTNHRIPTGSDYSEAKFLFEQEKGFMGPLKLSGNLGLSFYNRPDRTLNQQRLRNLVAALSFEGSSDSPFTEAENQSKITYSFVGRYERLFENRRMANRTPDIGALQFVMEIPLFKGLSLPLSVTYANATEEEKKQGFRFNFGTRFDMDKLVELLGAGSRP